MSDEERTRSESLSWLDHTHPDRYGLPVLGLGDGRREPRLFFGPEIEEAIARGIPVEVYNRCPTCEEWSPCRVREAYSLLWTIKVNPHGHPARTHPASSQPVPDAECPVCAPILKLFERDASC